MLYSSSKTEHFSAPPFMLTWLVNTTVSKLEQSEYTRIYAVRDYSYSILQIKNKTQKTFGVFFIISLTVLTFDFAETNGRPEKMLFIWTKPSDERLLYRSPELLQSSRSLCVPQTSSSSISCWLRKQYVTWVYTCKEYTI